MLVVFLEKDQMKKKRSYLFSIVTAGTGNCATVKIPDDIDV